MADFKIGVIVDSFRTGLLDGIRLARQIGADGIQIYATQGEMSPEALSPAKRRELLDRIASEGLVVSALCGDLGGHGFMVAEDNAWRIEKSKRIMELARDLDTRIVTTHIGVVPPDPHHPRQEILRQACVELARFGDATGAYFAIETGPETAAVLRDFLDSLGAKGVRVNLDPANLVMVTGDDPVTAVRLLAPYIVHTHAKDGIRLLVKSPEVIYGLLEEEIKTGEAFREVPLGQGSVDFQAYLRELDAIGYHGFLTIEREVGDNPTADIRLAVEFLKNCISRLNGN
ncbi:MAG TPA: xylose isomerase [Clostridiales bacterium]|nr:xylose isomerase [Clostridiales bacterium]